MTDNLYQNYSKDEKSSQKSGWTPYIEDDENQSEEDRPMEETKGKSKKKYSVIPQNIREKFIKRVLSKEVTIKEAAKEFGLKFSTSKAILQTYKKEGRIGKKKNRERKTKVVNAVFIANINQGSSFVNNLPLGPLTELKNMNFPSASDTGFGKSFDSELNKLSDPKLNKGSVSNGYKVTQNIIKEFGNDFLRDFIEKNFSHNRLPPLNTTGLDTNFSSTNRQDSIPSVSTFGSSLNTTTFPGAKHFINYGASNTNKTNPSAFSSISTFTANSSLLIPQKVSSINSDNPGAFNIPSVNQNKNFNQTQNSFLGNQKRAFHQYEKDSIPEYGSKNEQINDISVKKFKSGEDALWDFDMDKSKKDLEDFIYKTHNAMKNNLDDSKILHNFADFS